MSVHTATISAIALTGATVLVCLLGMWGVYRDLTSLWQELDTEMDAFKVLTDDMWRDMLAMGAGTPANRQRRQAAYNGVVATAGQQQRVGRSYGYAPPASNCRCKVENNCPWGPAGQRGAPGLAGEAGVPGRDGVPGQPAPDWQNAPFKGCFVSYFRHKTFSALNKAYSTLNKAYSALDKAYSALDKAHSTLNKAYSALNKAYSALNKAYSALNKAHSTLNKAYSALDKAHSTLNKAYSTLTETIL